MFDLIVGSTQSSPRAPGSPGRAGQRSPNAKGSPKKGPGVAGPTAAGSGELYEEELVERPVWQACLVVLLSPVWLPILLVAMLVGGLGVIIFTLIKDVLFFVDGLMSPEGKDEEDEDDRTNGADRAPGVPTIVEEFHHVDHGRLHFTSENLAFQDDPFVPVFKILDRVQELALPLLLGVVVSMAVANAAPDAYRYAFTAECTEKEETGYCNVTVVKKGDDKITTTVCVDYGEDTECDRWLMSDCSLFGSDVTLHFVANDIIMAFYFGLAMKEVTEALLPGGSLNPPRKAINPILTTIGGVLGAVGTFFLLLEIFVSTGLFDDELDSGCGGDGCSWNELSKGWGMVTATDIVLAWLVGRAVFGDGHPAIDYLLLLAVADDAIAMVIIAIFYPDPNKNVQPAWLLLVLAGMLSAYLLRKWHFRKKRATHQPWVPYILIGGLLSWIGLMKSHLHPALALVPIVPFMPGPNRANLEHLEEEVEDELEEEALEMFPAGGRAHNIMERRKSLDEQAMISRKSFDEGTPPPPMLPALDYIDDSDDKLAHKLHEHHEHSRGRGISIQAGLYAGLVGHGVEDALKVEEYDEDGNMHLYISTLDEFEHFFKFYVDIGLGIFAMVNAGVKIEGLGAMSLLVPLSLVIGKTGGVIVMDRVSNKWLGFPAPLGIRSRHVRMIGLIASLSLTGALFVAEVAFPTDEEIKGHSKIGALLSALVGFVCWGISQFQNFKEEDVVEQAHQQVEEEVAEEEEKVESRARRRSISGDSITSSREGSREGSRSTSREGSPGPGSPGPGLDLDFVELANRPGKLVRRDQEKKAEADLTGTLDGNSSEKAAEGSEGSSGGLKRSDSWFS